MKGLPETICAVMAAIGRRLPSQKGNVSRPEQTVLTIPPFASECGYVGIGAFGLRIRRGFERQADRLRGSAIPHAGRYKKRHGIVDYRRAA